MTRGEEWAGHRKRYDAAELSIALTSGLALAITALFLCVAPLTGQIAGGRDFVVYWSTGQQLAQHANPYDPDRMMRLERGAGLNPGYGVLFMRNPPWALPIALPLGFVGVRLGALLWSLVLLACLVVSVRIVWTPHGRQGNLLSFLGYSFAPALLCLIVGQTSLFALLGLALFLNLHTRRPFLAGACLWLCGIKPHLFVVFGAVLLAWAVVDRSYRVLMGAATAMAASCAAVWRIDPNAWSQYAQTMRSSGMEREFIPCLSVALRQWIGPQTMALQFIPSALGCVWALVYFWPRRHRWDWNTSGAPMMLVSLFTAPYCWLFDQALAIPALLHGASITRSRILIAALATASVAIEILMVGGVKLPSAVYLWTAPAWLAWYLLAMSLQRRPPAAEP
jgi:hypothetical protein